MEDQVLRSIANKNITERQLDYALRRLPRAVHEPSSFWTGIAGDRTYKLFHRRRAAAQLFYRHFSAGMTMGKVAHILNHPMWLRADDFYVVHFLMGWIPVAWNFDDTILVISFLPDHNSPAGTSVYLRISGKIAEASLRQFILGQSGKSSPLPLDEWREISRAVVREVATCDGPWIAHGHGRWVKLF